MGNIQVLKDALAWAKNNPDVHYQGDTTSCIVGHYLYSNDIRDHNITAYEQFSSLSGISISEASFLWSEFNSDNAGAVAYAESLIAKYDTTEVSVSEFEYVVKFENDEVAKYDNESDAAIAARAVVAYRTRIDGFNRHPVKLIKRPTTPVEQEISF